MRPSARANDQMRTVTLEPGFSKHAEGSCLVKFGNTHVLVHRQSGGNRTRLPARHRQGLGHGGIRHAAALDP